MRRVYAATNCSNSFVGKALSDMGSQLNNAKVNNRHFGRFALIE